MADLVRCRHRRVFRFINASIKRKCTHSPMGNKDRRYFLRYHLVCRDSGHLTTAPTRRLPLTQAIRQKILRDFPVPFALGGPFAAPLFAPISASGTLCGCAGSFTSASLVSYGFLTLNYRSVPLSRTFFLHRWIGLPFDPRRDRIWEKQKGCFQWITE